MELLIQMLMALVTIVFLERWLPLGCLKIYTFFSLNYYDGAIIVTFYSINYNVNKNSFCFENKKKLHNSKNIFYFYNLFIVSFC